MLGAGMPRSTDSLTAHRPKPESSTKGSRLTRLGSLINNVAINSRSQERITLPDVHKRAKLAYVDVKLILFGI